MNTKENNIIISLGNISNCLVQISKNINDNAYDYNDMLDKNLDKLQNVLQDVYQNLQKWT